MSRTSVDIPLPLAGAGQRSVGATVSSLIETTKPGITRLVTITSLVGFVLAGIGRSWAGVELAIALTGCVLGTALSAGGANALNQWWEAARDGRMARTARRPIPRGSLAGRAVLIAGLALTAAGIGLLWIINGAVPAGVALVCALSYLLIYTPLKPRSVTSTLVGAVPGALPPLIGWSAAHQAGGPASLTDPGGWSLVALMMIWQLPHFLAIAWMYRDQYAMGGFRVLPVVDPKGRATAWTMLATSVALLPMTLAPVWAMPEHLGRVTPAIALLTGLAYIALNARLVRTRSSAAAKRVFLASIMHLPILLLAMVGEAVVGSALG